MRIILKLIIYSLAKNKEIIIFFNRLKGTGTNINAVKTIDSHNDDAYITHASKNVPRYENFGKQRVILSIYINVCIFL